jgi:hypothetical protein
MSVASVFTQNAVRFRDSLKNEVQRWETHRAAHPLEAPLDVDEKVLAFLERIEEVFDRRIRVRLPCHAVLAAVLTACLRRCSATSSRSRPRRRTRPPCRCSMRSSTPCNRDAADLDACCLRGLLLRRPFPLRLACHCLLRLDARALLLFTCPVTLRDVSVPLQSVGRRRRRKRGKDAARDQMQLQLRPPAAAAVARATLRARPSSSHLAAGGAKGSWLSVAGCYSGRRRSHSPLPTPLLLP